MKEVDNMKKKYTIIGGIFDDVKIIKTDDIKEAILTWFNLEVKYPLNTSISCLSEDSRELIKWAHKNRDFIYDLLEKTDHLNTPVFLAGLDRTEGNKKEYDKYGISEVYPFSIG